MKAWIIGAILLGGLSAEAKPVPCPQSAPKGAACYVVVRTSPRAQCKGVTKAGGRCKRTVGVNKAGYCAQHKAQAQGK